MARGNIVQVQTVRKMFGLYVVVAFSGSFKDYDRVYISKAGTIIGEWRSFLVKPYKDYLRKVPASCKIVQMTDKYIVLKP